MKKTLIAVAVLALAALQVRAQEVSYALPRTIITVEAAYTQDIIHAGKYAKYAKDLLGIEVAQSDTVVTEITQFKLHPRVEADQSRRYSVNLTSNTRPTLLTLTEQGLVSGSDAELKHNGRQAGYRKPEPKPKAEPKVKKTYYEEQIVPGVDSLGNEISDTILVEIIPVDSLFLEAQDAAEGIVELREQRYKILTGDTDASYSGEALGAALAELSRMENELLALFQPAVQTVKGRAFFDIVPDKEGAVDVFTLDPDRGLVKPTGTGETFELVIVAEPVAEAPAAAPTKKQPSQKLFYRIPALCTVTLTDGSNDILSARIPIYQLGLEATYPLYD